MLELDSTRWSQLSHAYGDATDIPAELRRLETLSSDDDFEVGLLTLLESLEHQGDAYSAALAAAPHVARIGESRSVRCRAACIEVVTLFELARRRCASRGIAEPEVPADVAEAYFATVRRLPEMITGCFQNESEFNTSKRLIGAYMVVEGESDVGRKVLWAWHPDAKARSLQAHRELFPDDAKEEDGESADPARGGRT